MTHKIIAALALLALAILPAAADEKPPLPLAELCKQVFCRVPSVRLRVDANRVYEQPAGDPVPVLLPNGWVSVYAGETVYLEVEVKDGQLNLLRAVPKPEKADTTLVLKFEQLEGKPDVMLTVNNPLAVDIRFRMGFMGLDSDRIRATSSCPVLAGKSLFEHWRHPIFQLILANAQVLAASDDHSCK